MRAERPDIGLPQRTESKVVLHSLEPVLNFHVSRTFGYNGD